MKKQISDKLDKIADKINAVAIAVFIASGVLGLGYGAIMGIGGAFKKRAAPKASVTAPAPEKRKSVDTVDYMTVLQMMDSVKTR